MILNSNVSSVGVNVRQKDINDILKNIADSLIEKLPKIESFGLYDGKAGVALYLFYYAKYFSLPKIDDVAFGVLAQISDISSDFSDDLTFSNGLAGIGWLIEHLVQNGYAEGSTDEILADLDQKFEQPINILDYSLKNGICGYGLYSLTRILNYKSKFYDGKENKFRNNLIQIIGFLDYYLPNPNDVIEI